MGTPRPDDGFQESDWYSWYEPEEGLKVFLVERGVPLDHLRLWKRHFPELYAWWTSDEVAMFCRYSWSSRRVDVWIKSPVRRA